jgi:hypothetical protein
MNVISLLVTDTQSTPEKQPLETGFDDVAEDAQAAAVRFIAACDRRLDEMATQRVPDLFFRVVGSIYKYFVRPTSSRPIRLFDADFRGAETD